MLKSLSALKVVVKSSFSIYSQIYGKFFEQVIGLRTIVMVKNQQVSLSVLFFLLFLSPCTFLCTTSCIFFILLASESFVHLSHWPIISAKYPLKVSTSSSLYTVKELEGPSMVQIVFDNDDCERSKNIDLMPDWFI